MNARRSKVGVVFAIAALLAIAAPAGAQPVATDLGIDAAPLLLPNGAPSFGWNEMLVSVVNNGTKPARGDVEIRCQQLGDKVSFRATGPYSVGAGNSINVRMPVWVGAYQEVVAIVRDEAGHELINRHFNPTTDPPLVLVDIGPQGQTRVLDSTPMSVGYQPASSGGGGGWGPPPPRASPPSLLSVTSPPIDNSTGDPILPDRAALWMQAAAVVVRSERLALVHGAELDALAGYVLAGGTLSIVMTRPEDVRNPTVVALVGAEPSGGPVAAAALPAPAAQPGRPIAPKPTDDVAKGLVAYAGGNLHPSAFGASAAYGLGEVHLLAFDPTRKPGVDDPWVKARVVDLVRRAYDRRASLVARLGVPNDNDTTQVRKQLDPNEGSRWAIAIATLLLILYAVAAGPINFSLSAKSGKPLRALRWLVGLSVGTFFAVVGIGAVAKGVRGRARHLTVVDAGAGMTRGAARRWRGFYASSASELTVRTSDASGVAVNVGEGKSADDEPASHLLVDRDGARLVDVAALPWQTVVVREDGMAELGGGISLTLAQPDVVVTNRTGRDLRGAILMLPGGSLRFFDKIKDGEAVKSSTGTDMASSADSEMRGWVGQLTRGGTPAGSFDIHTLYGGSMRFLDKSTAGLGSAWAAIDASTGLSVDWFPDDVPVLLAQLDGGEGKTKDAGLGIDSDRVLVRVVGYGGRP